MSHLSENRCLFVALPEGETVSLKQLDERISVRNLIARVELLAGVPADIFTLHYLGRPLENSILLNFRENIHSGAILRLVIKPKWNTLYKEICNGSRSLKEILDNYKPNKSAGDLTGQISTIACL